MAGGQTLDQDFSQGWVGHLERGHNVGADFRLTICVLCAVQCSAFHHIPLLVQPLCLHAYPRLASRYVPPKESSSAIFATSRPAPQTPPLPRNKDTSALLVLACLFYLLAAVFGCIHSPSHKPMSTQQITTISLINSHYPLLLLPPALTLSSDRRAGPRDAQLSPPEHAVPSRCR